MMNEKNWILEKSSTAQAQGKVAYLLLDSAQAEGSHLKLEQWNVPYFSLFDGTPEENLIEIAPLLIPLNELDSETLKRLTVWASALGYAHPCISMIISSLPGAELAVSLCRYHVAGIDDDQTMLMRWYDTRILPIWMAALELGQRAQFAAGITQWDFINRFGDLSTCYRLEPGTKPATPEKLLPMQPAIVLSSRQFALLVDATDVDTLLAHLRRVIPDETSKVPPKRLFEFVSEFQRMAIEAGVDDIDRQAQYVILALYTSGAGVKHPACVALMKSPPAALDDFYDALQALPDEVWKAGKPLWENPALLAA